MPLQNDRLELILASRSAARIALLEGAGLTFRTLPADLDEDALRREMTQTEPDDVAMQLAQAKARHVSAANPDALVIGADQVLSFDGEILAKPADRQAAALQLARLGTNTHSLHSACVCAMSGNILWRCVDSAHLTMRPLSPQFIACYLDSAGDQVLASVGAYQLEGLGAHLFAAIAGDYFTILGLPLLPLLAFMRQHGVIADMGAC